MKKFPVISENGNVYQVNLFVGESIALAGFNIIIKERREGFFGIEYFKELRRFRCRMSEEEMFEEYGGYVDIAKYFVNKYEREIKEKIEFDELRNKLAKEFDDWDGIC